MSISLLTRSSSKTRLALTLGKAWMGLLIALCAVITTPTFADVVEYRYDALGRVTEAINTTSGQATIYDYDAAGNITTVRNAALTAVAVASFTPVSGPVNALVTISGSGFSTVLTDNVVQFNGIAGTVTSATATKIVARVPTGATTGFISVANTAGTDTSRAKFTVTAASAPRITSFTPTRGAAGTAVTVTGAGFAASAGQNRLRFNQTLAAVTGVTGTTQLQTTVPEKAASGKLQITTAEGTGLSAADFLVLPPGITSAQVAVSGRMTVNAAAATPVALSSANTVAMELFDGTAGQYLTLRITDNTIPNNTQITVIAPNGATLVMRAISGSATSLPLPRLKETGTYTLLINPGANTGSLSLALLGPLTGTMTVGGTAQTLNVVTPGQYALLTFSGTANAFVTLAWSNSALVGGSISLLKPDGEALSATNLTGPSGALKPKLPITGTYTVVIAPSDVSAGNITLSLANSAATTFNLPAISGSNQSVNSTAPTLLTFNAAQGEYVSLTVQEASSQIASALVNILAPSGAVVASGTLTATYYDSCNPRCGAGTYSGKLILQAGPLPEAGTYTISARAQSGSGTLGFILSNPAQGLLNVDGAALTLAAAQYQTMLLTFEGASNQYLKLNVTATSSKIQNASIKVLDPAGNVQATGTLTTQEDIWCARGTCSPTGFYSGTAVINTGKLLITGIYSVFVVPTNGENGNLTYSLISSQNVDEQPDPFIFNDVSNVLANTEQISNTISITGINMTVPVSVANGQYSKNGGSYTSASGTAVSGDQFTVKHTSASQDRTSVTTQLAVGGVTDAFTSTTGVQDTTPNAFTFNDVSGVPLGSQQTSNTITVSGITGNVAVTVSGGSYSKNGGGFTTSAGIAAVGDTFRVMHTASCSRGGAVNTTLSIGTVSDTFTSTASSSLIGSGCR